MVDTRSRGRSVFWPLSGSRLPLPGLVLLAFSSLAGAQEGEFDRQIDPDRVGEERVLPPADPPPGSGSPASQPVPDQHLPPGQRDPNFIPEQGVDPSLFPDWTPPPPPQDPVPPSLWDEFDLRLDGRLLTTAGYDSNVFRAESSRRDDGFFHARAEGEALLRFPQGSEIVLEVSGDTLLYFQREKANEYFLSTFFEYYHPITDWLDAGFQNTFELSKQNLLDDNGDLFPRGRFGSLDEEPRLYTIFRPHQDLSLETGASYRIKDYEENSGVSTLR